MSVKDPMKTLLLPALVAALWMGPVWSNRQEESTQEGAETEEDAPYTQEEYNAYQQAVQTADPAAREDTIIAFMTANPQSKLLDYAIGEYTRLLQQYQSESNHAKVISAGEKFLPAMPAGANHDYRLNVEYMIAFSAYQTQQWDKAAQYGEKVYEVKPDLAGLTFMLAIANQGLNNQEEYVRYGKLACAQLEPKDCYQILADLTRISAANQNWVEAAEYAQQALVGLEAAQKPPQLSDADWNKYITEQKAIANAVQGRQAAERKNWPAAAGAYRKVLALNANPALNGEAHFYIGMAQWQQGQIDPAMTSFARGSVISRAPHAKASRESLEKLYSSTHNGSLAGIEEFVSRAASGR